MTTLQSKAQWAESVGVTVKSVERWLTAGLVPEAVRQSGRWWFPAGTPRPTEEAIAAAAGAGAGATSRDVAPVAAPAPADLVAPTSMPFAVGGTLEEFAAMTGCSPLGVRRLFDDMKANPGLPFYVGRYGRHGKLRMVMMPRG